MNDMQEKQERKDPFVNTAILRMRCADVRRYTNDIQDMSGMLHAADLPGRQNDALVADVLRIHLYECRELLAEYLTTGDPDPLLAALTEQKEYDEYNPVLWLPDPRSTSGQQQPEEENPF